MRITSLFFAKLFRSQGWFASAHVPSGGESREPDRAAEGWHASDPDWDGATDGMLAAAAYGVCSVDLYLAVKGDA